MRPALADIVAQLRTVAGLGSSLPVAGGSMAIGVLTRSKRDGVKLLHGVLARTDAHGGRRPHQLRRGREPGRMPSRGVHRQSSKQLRCLHRCSTGPRQLDCGGEEELGSHPIAGTIDRIVDAAFIERDDPLAGVDGLRKVEELARNSLSIIIAPERTRTDTSQRIKGCSNPPQISMTDDMGSVPSGILGDIDFVEQAAVDQFVGDDEDSRRRGEAR